MNSIQQMYCTHCTHGSSALERCQGELAARMLGYSVRAGSLDSEALRQAYRQVERHISYHLPRDAPAEDKLRLTAATAPQRLIFIPAAGTWEVIGLVSYRQRDTEGRPGSYFAHLVCRQAAEGHDSWTLLDALRLWKAPGWVVEDSPEHPFVLPAIPAIDCLLDGEPPRIGDRALLAFLQGDDRSFGSHLPDRWRDLLPAKRVEIFQNLVASLLAVGTTRRQTLLVAVEPEVAALLFYGVGRLVPPGKLRASVSVSTFEASAERLTTVLAATTFCDPRAADFRAESLRGRGLAINTFGPQPAGESIPSAYAQHMVGHLLNDGPAAVDQRLATMAAAQPDRIEKLEEFARTEYAVAALFRSAGAAGGSDSWRSDSTLTDFARRLTRERLAAVEGSPSTLNAVCGGQSQTTILQLAATVQPGTGADRAIRFLLEKLSEERIAPFVAGNEIADDWKIELLRSRIAATGRTPAATEWIWTDGPVESPLDADRRSTIAAGVIGDLPPQAITGLLCSLDASLRPVVMERLLVACRQRVERWEVFADVLRRFDIDSLIVLWRRFRSRLFDVPDAVGEVISTRLEETLNTLHQHPGEFSPRLEFLEAGQRWLAAPDAAARLAAWRRCREAIIELIGLKDSRYGVAAACRLEKAAQRMTESILEAVPAAHLEDDRQGTARQTCLRKLGRHLGGGEELLPTGQWQHEALWKKIGWRMEMGNWPSISLRKLAQGPAERWHRWVALAIAAVVVLGVLGVIGLSTIGTGPRRSQGLVVEHARADRPPIPASGEGGLAPGNPAQRNRGASGEGLSGKPAAPGRADETAPDPSSPEPAGSQPAPGGEAGDPVGLGSERPLLSIPGQFAASMSAVGGLERPAIAVMELHVQDAADKPLSRAFAEKYVLGAVIRQQRGDEVAADLDLPDLLKLNQARLHDGIDRVRVQFRFSRKTRGSPGAPAGIEAVSFSWAEVLIEPAQRYDIRFVVSPEGIKILDQLAGEDGSPGPQRTEEFHNP